MGPRCVNYGQLRADERAPANAMFYSAILILNVAIDADFIMTADEA
jgi:hypothetical protein